MNLDTLRFRKQGLRWTVEERSLVVKLIQEGKTLREISINVGRSERGVAYEISKIVQDKVSEGKTVNDLVADLKVSKEFITEMIKSGVNFKKRPSTNEFESLTLKVRKLENRIEFLAEDNQRLTAQLKICQSKLKTEIFRGNKLFLENLMLQDSDISQCSQNDSNIKH